MHKMVDIVRYVLTHQASLFVLGYLLIMVPIFGIMLIHRNK